MIAQTDAPSESQYPRQPYKAGFWLIAIVPLVLLVAVPLETWVHRQDIQNAITFPVLLIILWWTAYRWASALVKRSGLKTGPIVGVAAAIALSVTILGEFAAFETTFGAVLQALDIPKTLGGTHDEFMVIFVMWTGMVTGGCGCAVGLALKQPRLALKLLGLGLLSGAITFFAVALVMEMIGFRVGTPRPDGLPSMPIVTILGIWSTALIGSELFGQVLARSNHTSAAI
jgi:hypothetical protein